MIKDTIPTGRYEVVVAAADDCQTRAEHYMRRLTVVVIGPARGTNPTVSAAEYMGGVLYAFPVDHMPAMHMWEGAVNNPRDFVVGQRFNADVIRENLGEDHGWRSRVGRLELRDGDDMPEPREIEEPEPEEPARRIRRESVSRRSAVERERDRIEETVATFLFETAEPEPTVWPEVGGTRGMTGVVFPDAGIEGGAILQPGYARRLGAHLIRAADLHDEIQDSGR